VTFVRDHSLSVRENILRYVSESFSDVRAGEDGYTTTWGQKIIRRPFVVDDLGRALDVLEIVDSREERRPEVNKSTDKMLLVNLTFYHKIVPNEKSNSSSVLNRILVDVQRRMHAISSEQFGGLAITADEVGSEFDVDGSGDSIVNGISVWSIHYRHLAADPRRLKGE
jgi:hypothetical protein